MKSGFLNKSSENSLNLKNMSPKICPTPVHSVGVGNPQISQSGSSRRNSFLC